MQTRKGKIAKRRLEIDGAIKQETRLKATREAEKKRQSRGRGGRRSLAQETMAAPAMTQPVVSVPQVAVAAEVPTMPIQPIAVAQETQATQPQVLPQRATRSQEIEEDSQGSESD